MTTQRAAMQPWLDRCSIDCLAAAGGLDGADAPSRRDRRRALHSAKPYVYDPVPRRDERFPDLCNQGVNAEAFLYDPSLPPRSRRR